MMADNGVYSKGVAMYPKVITRIGADLVVFEGRADSSILWAYLSLRHANHDRFQQLGQVSANQVDKTRTT